MFKLMKENDKRPRNYEPRVISLLLAFTLIITAGVLGFEGSAGAWTRNMDFESGLTAADGFTYAGTTVYWESSKAQSGSHSARVQFVQGTNCWNTCHARYDAQEDILCGEELWTRAYYYFPVGWDWGDQADGASNCRKILRFGLLTSEGGYAGGYVSIMAYWHLPNDSEIFASTEPGGYDFYDKFTGISYPIGEWLCLEQYVLFGTDNETARHIIWLNETRVFDSADIGSGNDKKTMLDPTDHCGTVYFFSAWNGYVRTTQDAYIDNVVVTTDTPSKTDAGGFPMIGAETFPQGDVTGDDSVDITDVQACVNHILAIQDWGSAADVNGDSAVNVLDVQAIVNIVLEG